MILRSRASTRAIVPAIAIACGLLVTSCSGDGSSSAGTTSTPVVASSADPSKPQSTVILDKQAQTVLDQLLQYPTGSQAQVSSAVLTFAPGASTGLHKHGTPQYVYVLEGTITVTYEGGVVKEYSAGSAILEAIDTAHNGENRTDTPVTLLVVNMGADGVANTITL